MKTRCLAMLGMDTSGDAGHQVTYAALHSPRPVPHTARRTCRWSRSLVPRAGPATRSSGSRPAALVAQRCPPCPASCLGRGMRAPPRPSQGRPLGLGLSARPDAGPARHLPLGLGFLGGESVRPRARKQIADKQVFRARSVRYRFFSSFASRGPLSFRLGYVFIFTRFLPCLPFVCIQTASRIVAEALEFVALPRRI